MQNVRNHCVEEKSEKINEVAEILNNKWRANQNHFCHYNPQFN